MLFSYNWKSSKSKKILEKKIYKLKKEIKSLIESELERLNKCLYKDENEYAQ